MRVKRRAAASLDPGSPLRYHYGVSCVVRLDKVVQQLGVGLVTSQWAEGSLTFTTAPTAQGARSPSPVSTAEAFLLVNVTSQVQTWIASPGSNFGLEITGVGGAAVSLDSKENTSTSHPAVIEILIAGATGPTARPVRPGPRDRRGPAGAAGAAGATGPTGPAGPPVHRDPADPPDPQVRPAPTRSNGTCRGMRTHRTDGATRPTGSAGAVGVTGPSGLAGAPGARCADDARPRDRPRPSRTVAKT